MSALKYKEFDNPVEMLDFFNNSVGNSNLYHRLKSSTFNNETKKFQVFYEDFYDITVLPEEGYIDEEEE